MILRMSGCECYVLYLSSSFMAQSYYITTAIDYVNGRPHLGHAYEKVLADLLARYHRRKGEDVFFLTGVDEHGQKVQQSAAKRGIDPQLFCDEMAAHFKDLCDQLNISYNYFVRTTEPKHKKVVADILNDLYERGEIYRGSYEGYYSARQEQFLTEKEMVDGKFPEIYGEVTRISEPVYFFKMTKYLEPLKEYLNSHPDFVYPLFRAKEILGALEHTKGDLCISRPRARVSWGISLPFDTEQVTYVWFDALINYISIIGYGTPEFNKYWPAVHVIGKDILVPAHSIYWTTMLMALGVPLPRKIIAHGWWTQNQEKMSKSLGNVVDPLSLIDRYGVDAFRYFVMREMSVGQDADFSYAQFHQRYESDLANDLGNLVNRLVSMVHRYLNSQLKKIDLASEHPLDLDLKKAVEQAILNFQEQMDHLQVHQAIQSLWQGFTRANQYVEENAPWKLAKDPSQADRLAQMLGLLTLSIAQLAIELSLILPHTAEKIWDQFGLTHLNSFNQMNKTKEQLLILLTQSTFKQPQPLFPKIDLSEVKKS